MINNEYIFHYVNLDKGEETFFCSCGDYFKKNSSEIDIKVKGDFFSNLNVENFSNLKGTGLSIKCPHCDKDYDSEEVVKNIKPVNAYFSEEFVFEETDEKVSLYRIKTKALYENDATNYTLKNKKSSLSFNKDSRILTYCDFNLNKKEFTLNDVIKVVESFFSKDGIERTSGLFEIHKFINRMANFVVDSKNFDIVEELMSGLAGNMSFEVFSKIISIFFGIITYPSLSTIALTKGLVFLYDMMKNCPLPNPSVLSDEKATSPVKIFSFLINLQHKKIQDEIDLDDINKQGYVFKSEKGDDVEFLFDVKRYDIEDSKISKDEGINVREELELKRVSKYIFNKVKTFGEYNELIKYTKFITYEELISLVMKYNIELLLKIYSKIEFRDDIDLKKLHQIIPLIISFVKRVQLGGASAVGWWTEFDDRFKPKNHIDKSKKNYKDAISDDNVNLGLIDMFDFDVYDDCVRMIYELEWDVNKEFSKIKDVDELEDYHNKLVEHYNLLTDEEKRAKFKDFIERFLYLQNYDGPLNVKLLETPKDVLKEAKLMRNCAGSYVSRISKGTYVLLIVEDLSEDIQEGEDTKFMLGLHVTPVGLEFDQVKASFNKQGSDRFKKTIMKYLRKKEISYRELTDLRLVDMGKDIFDVTNENV